MPDIKRVMETDEKGVARQIYPVTHIDAVEGWEFDKLNLPLANEYRDGIMSRKMVQKINELSNSNLTIEKVGEV